VVIIVALSWLYYPRSQPVPDYLVSVSGRLLAFQSNGNPDEAGAEALRVEMELADAAEANGFETGVWDYIAPASEELDDLEDNVLALESNLGLFYRDGLNRLAGPEDNQ
jgi:hypothetical protein